MSVMTTMHGPQMGRLMGNPVFSNGVPTFHPSIIMPTYMHPDYLAGSGPVVNWVDSMGFPHGQTGGRTLWSMSGRNASKHSRTDTSMPDYVSSQGGQSVNQDSMHLSSSNLDDDATMSQLKVPTNTPTAGNGGCGASFSFDAPNLLIPGDLACSLTQSLLNQPRPLPPQPQRILLPTSEVKPRKEHRHLNSGIFKSSPVSSPSPTTERLETRKISQSTSLASSTQETRRNSTTGPKTRAASIAQLPFLANASRSISNFDFGTNIINCPTPSPAGGAITLGKGLCSAGSGKSLKRGRNFTPASARAIDDEDEPRRVTPRLWTSAQEVTEIQEN